MPSAAASAQDRQFGKYSLVAKLATGGMAEIYLARLQGTAGFEKLVCIKRILPRLAKDKQFVSMFLSEARIAAQISHPNVCQVFELGEIDGALYIAMEYLEGVPLSCFRRRDLYPDPPSARLIAGLGVQGCEGLHHAHQLKRADGAPLDVVHRDISGNNLFATVDGVVKVLDFGIAKANADADGAVKTSTGSVKGTYAYMSPEQLRGKPVDRRTDVFAMGIVLWELACHKHLFKRETEFLTFQAIVSDPIPDIRELRPELPAELAAVVTRALSRKRGDRFATARELGLALGQSVAGVGGPFAAAALSEEIERAFRGRLGEQRALIQVAREGGGFDLETDLGPGVGHGSAMMSTPLSIVSGPPTASERARSETMSVVPLVLRPSRARVALAIGGPVLAIAGAVAAYSLTRDSSDAADVVGSTPRDAAPDAVAIARVAVDAGGAGASDAGALALAPDAGAGAGAGAGSGSAKPLHPVHVVPAAPGFITIDSAPVYAVIFIDGKRYGETPLVHLSLAAGRHAVRAVDPNGKAQTVAIVIEPGKVATTRRIEW